MHITPEFVYRYEVFLGWRMALEEYDLTPSMWILVSEYANYEWRRRQLGKPPQDVVEWALKRFKPKRRKINFWWDQVEVIRDGKRLHEEKQIDFRLKGGLSELPSRESHTLTCYGLQAPILGRKMRLWRRGTRE